MSGAGAWGRRARARWGRAPATTCATRWSVNYEHENRRTPTTDWQSLSSLSTTYTWVRRKVDNVIEPRSGNIIRLLGSVGAAGTSISDAFLQGQGRVQQYIPVRERDVLILRGDLGYVE